MNKIRDLLKYCLELNKRASNIITQYLNSLRHNLDEFNKIDKD